MKTSTIFYNGGPKLPHIKPLKSVQKHKRISFLGSKVDISYECMSINMGLALADQELVLLYEWFTHHAKVYIMK